MNTYGENFRGTGGRRRLGDMKSEAPGRITGASLGYGLILRVPQWITSLLDRSVAISIIKHFDARQHLKFGPGTDGILPANGRRAKGPAGRGPLLEAAGRGDWGRLLVVFFREKFSLESMRRRSLSSCELEPVPRGRRRDLRFDRVRHLKDRALKTRGCGTQEKSTAAQSVELVW